MEIITKSSSLINKKEKKEKKEILLNHFIFKDLLIYLINKLNFKQILEISLLSKKIFKWVQNIIAYRGNECMIEFQLSSLANYIKNCNSTTSNNLIKYQFKLIQYKEIENLSIISEISLPIIKKSLQFACKNLKKVRIVNKRQVSFFENQDDDEEEEGDNLLMLFDDTYNNFFSFKRVHLNWYSLQFPCSNLEEYEFIDKQMVLHNYNEIQNYPFSFNFLMKLLPQKVYIDGSNCQFELFQLNSILNQSNQITLSTIKFINHATPLNFISFALSKSNIKSLSIILETNQNHIYDTNEYIYLILFKSNLHQTNTLKRLIINIYSKNVYGTNPELLLNLLINYNNISIEALGLECYDITNDNLLLPLLKLRNIKILYCRFNNLNSFLKHLIQNQNIKKLKIKIDKDSIQHDEFDLILNQTLKLLKSFYKQLQLQLQPLNFKKLIFIYDQQQLPLNKNVKNLTTKLNNYINKKLKLK